MPKKRYSVQQEMELYEGFHYMVCKYGKDFLDWYHENSTFICDVFPYIENPSNPMEKDNNLCLEKIKNPRNYSLNEMESFEKKVCDFLAQNLTCTKVIMNDNYKKMSLFLNRYDDFRRYYMIALEN